MLHLTSCVVYIAPMLCRLKVEIITKHPVEFDRKPVMLLL